MKKSSLILGILVIIFGLVFFMGTKDVMAADDEFEAIIEDTKATNSTPTTDNTQSKNGNVSGNNNANKANNNANKANNNANVSNNNANKSNNLNSNNNVSNYNNTPNSLSKAGIEDSIPTMVLIVIFAISAIYAFKKINDYKNV